jgi:predicted Zn-dependent protease with MMP-like domain
LHFLARSPAAKRSNAREICDLDAEPEYAPSGWRAAAAIMDSDRMRGMMELPPSLDDFERLARSAWAALPESFRTLAGDVVFRIEDFADDEILDEMHIEDPFELSGLYLGVDLTRQSVTDPSRVIPMVFLYRRPILDEWTERGDVALSELVEHVLVHEIGHHFGLSDEEMHAILEKTE